MKKLYAVVACQLLLAAGLVAAQTPSTSGLITDKWGAIVPQQYWDSTGLTFRIVQQAGATPSAATTIAAASGNVANASAVATLPGVAAKTTYINGFEMTGAGATAGSIVNATITGLVGGTLTYTFVVPTGATVGAVPLIVTFPQPLPASAVNTAIVVTLPALGTGNTNAAVVAHGYQQ